MEHLNLQHFFNAHFDGLGGASVCDVTDFTAGQDKLGMALSYATPEGVGAGYLSSSSIWSILDTNGDGVLTTSERDAFMEKQSVEMRAHMLQAMPEADICEVIQSFKRHRPLEG